MGLPLFLSSLLLSLTVSAGPMGGIVPGDAHDPIRIESDADLARMDLLSGNGVRGGTGTASDPYLISHWTIRPEDGEPGLSVQGTRSHLLIDNLTIETPGGGSTAVFASDTANLRIRHVYITGDGASLSVVASRDVVIERAIIEAGDLKASGNDGLVVKGNQLGRGSIEIQAIGRTVVRENIVAASDGVGIAVDPTFVTDSPSAFNLVLEKNRVERAETGIRLTGAQHGHACRNMVEDVEGNGLDVSAYGDADSAFVTCGNHVAAAGGFGIRLYDQKQTAVHNNTVTESAVGFTWGNVTGSIRDNFVTRNEIGFSLAPVPEGPAPVVDRNVVVENTVAARNTYRVTVDLEENWWGTSQDPRLAGEGQQANGVFGPIDVSPWCMDPSCERLSTDVVDVPLGGTWALLSVGLASVFCRPSRTRR